MIQPIKPKRLFTGLVGMPPESENYPSQPVFDPAQVAPVATVLVSAPATSKKAGRTRKHKSDADRKATYYAKSTEAQRMALVAKIMWRVRAAVAKPLGPEDG